MKLKTVILIAICSLPVCLANSLPPFAGQCAVVDRVLDAARAGSPTAETALKILEMVVLGRMDAADPQLETRIGLGHQVRGSDYRSGTVREYALLRIGKVDLPETLEFLQNLKKEDLDPDPSATLWPTVSIAVHQARLTRIPEPLAKIKFLEDTLGEWNAAVSWAATSGTSASDQIAYCEARIAVLSRASDRIAALRSVLNVNDTVSNRQLIGWAILQLDAMRSDRADAELKQYAADLDSQMPPQTSPLWMSYLNTQDEIRQLLARRGK